MTEWIITCNTDAYDVAAAFDKLKMLDWKQSTSIEVGDTVYIYVGAPVGAIAYKCEVVKTEQPEPLIDDSEFILESSNYSGYGRYMRLQLLEQYDDPRLELHKLKENGLKTVQGLSKVASELSAYINSVTSGENEVLDRYAEYKKSVPKTRREAITILQRAYNRPVTARELTNLMYEVGTHQANVNSELNYMMQQGLVEKVREEKPSSYIVKKNVGEPNYFYVFQSQSFKEECAGEYLWAPKYAKDGSQNHHWTRMKEVKKGDVIFHGYRQKIIAVSIAKKDAYSAERPGELSVDAWNKDGWKVDSAYYIFNHSIAPKDYWNDIKLLQSDQYSPFDNKNGSGNMGGLFPVSQELARYFLDAIAGKKNITVGTENAPVIEDVEGASLLSEKADDIIENHIKQFVKRLPEVRADEQELEALREKFVNDYNINAIMNMTKEEYVVGLDSKTSFCYRLETELQELGNIHGATSEKFGLYYGKRGNETEKTYRSVKKYSEDPDVALEKIKEQIVFLIMNGEQKNYEAIRKCELGQLVRGKILAVFFPEDYLCIFSDKHLDYFIKKLGITSNISDDVLDKQSKLIEWKKSRPEMKEWTNYLFSRFLYFSFGRPLEESISSIQKKRDDAYPKDYVSNDNMTIEQWKKLLSDPEVFRPEDIELLKRFYIADNHATTCYDLSIQDGVSPSSYITPIVALAKRIVDEMQIPEIVAADGSKIWWRILFWGRYREDGRFEWKLRPRLAKAMSDKFPDLDSNTEIEEREDNELVEELKHANVDKLDEFEYVGKPKEKEEAVYSNGHKTYPRDRQTALNALAHAHYVCEIDVDHPTFIRKKSDKKYTEPHHLVPMAFSDEFDVSLDVEENIVSLCSNCHNQIHYGKGGDKLLKKLYAERKEALESVGIKITLTQLLQMYGCGDK